MGFSAKTKESCGEHLDGESGEVCGSSGRDASSDPVTSGADSRGIPFGLWRVKAAVLVQGLQESWTANSHLDEK